MGKEMVKGLDQMSDVAGWFEKYKGITKQIDEQLLRGLQESGKGLTLEQLQLVVEHQNPFYVVAPQTFLDLLVSKTAKILSKRFGKKIAVDPLPLWFTEENLAHAARYNLKPISLPAEEISEDRKIRNWIKPRKWFYDQIAAKNIAADNA